MKSVLGIYSGPASHWVGDGFPVRTLFSYDRMGKQLSPFLLLDFAGPSEFTPARAPRGVGEHPHRGFETVTIVYSGEVAHRDSAGNGGSIGPGDVQWMTAGAGIMHEEFHSEGFTRRGGKLEMAQLWVNLPAKDKMAPPQYQTITSAMIPDVTLDNNAGRVRVIAGTCAGVRGPARTFTQLNVWDVRLNAGASCLLDLPEGHNTILAVLQGQVQIGSGQNMGDAALAVLSATGSGAWLRATTDATLLALSGQPIDEPIVGYGPFVMNTRNEIVTAFNDLESGRFGQLEINE
ncbi:MAG: pirin family protein [Pseudomonadota bacterium]